MVGTRSSHVSAHVPLAKPLTDAAVGPAAVVTDGCWNVPMVCRDVYS